MNFPKRLHMSSVARKSSIALLGLALLGLALSLSLVGCDSDEIDKLVIADVDLASVKDGVYEAEQDNSPVTAKVQVEVKDGKIASIKVVKHGHGPGHSAKNITDRVIAAQSLKVDSVSGATGSSKVMLKAIESALEKGL
jgi:uncharacterized protein with FMN-binding domain